MTPPLPMFDDSETAAVNVADPVFACRAMDNHANLKFDERGMLMVRPVQIKWITVSVFRTSGAIETICRTQDAEKAQWAASRFMVRYNEALKEKA